jgi:hypothetical protein
MKRLLILLAALLYSIPAFAQSTQQLCFTTNGANCVPAVAASSSAKVDVATGTTTEIVALTAGKNIFVTSFNLFAGGTGTIKFVYGTGSACGTGTTDLTGAYPLKDQGSIAVGSGHGLVLYVPASNALCVTTSASVQISGSVSYAKF